VADDGVWLASVIRVARGPGEIGGVYRWKGGGVEEARNIADPGGTNDAKMGRFGRRRMGSTNTSDTHVLPSRLPPLVTDNACSATTTGDKMVMESEHDNAADTSAVVAAAARGGAPAGDDSLEISEKERQTTGKERTKAIFASLGVFTAGVGCALAGLFDS